MNYFPNPFEKAFAKLEPEGSKNAVEKSALVVPDTLESATPSSEIVVRSSREVMNPFALVRDLFEFAQENNIEHTSSDRYYDSNNEYPDNPYAKKLPQKFSLLVAEYPGDYYVVAYENRADTYYRQGTRHRFVKLSTVPKRSETNEAVREIDITEPVPSEGFGNVLFLSINDSVMNAARINLNTAEEGQIDLPHGSSKIKYEVQVDGSKKIIESTYNRLDEGIFVWKGKEEPVRWNRDLHVVEGELVYEDAYIIGRHHQGEEERTKIKITVGGNIDAPDSVLISIGLPSEKGTVIHEDLINNIKVVLQDKKGLKAFQNQEAILQEDPNYAFIFSGVIDKEAIISLLRNKVEALTNDWNKSTPVFQDRGLEEGTSQIAE